MRRPVGLCTRVEQNKPRNDHLDVCAVIYLGEVPVSAVNICL